MESVAKASCGLNFSSLRSNTPSLQWYSQHTMFSFSNSVLARQISALLTLFLLAQFCQGQKDNGRKCDCFKTNESTETYFNFHRFFDYRDISDRYVTPSPPVITDALNTSNADATSDFFDDSSWTDDWDIQTWDNSDSLESSETDASVLMIYSRNNVYIEASSDGSSDYNTYLTLRTTRTTDFQSSGEIDSTEIDYQYLSVRFLARIIGDEGACAGFFTWRCPELCRSPSSPDVEEADVEMLTRDSIDTFHFTNQPSESINGQFVPESTRNQTFPDGMDRTQWNEYRYDWLPGLSTWYINGINVAEIAFQAPRNPAALIINMWGNGGSWTGNMSVGDAAYLQLQWIQVVYNTSESLNNADGCQTVCNVDTNVTAPGVPVAEGMGFANRPILRWALAFTLVVVWQNI
ncbi:Beta-glucanase 4 [Phlyctema vagabunda]|uniref:Beta-glucanase 4 n=1 Tax=Phlyctema vagabunda TaxID=108571 RepID=A0ABR4PCZ8_9HELO